MRFSINHMPIVENGSLCDYYEHGGQEEDILKYLLRENRRIEPMPVGGAKRITFSFLSEKDKQSRFLIQIWVLKITDDQTFPLNYRFCYSSQEVQDQILLRGFKK